MKKGRLILLVILSLVVLIVSGCSSCNPEAGPIASEPDSDGSILEYLGCSSSADCGAPHCEDGVKITPYCSFGDIGLGSCDEYRDECTAGCDDGGKFCKKDLMRECAQSGEELYMNCPVLLDGMFSVPEFTGLETGVSYGLTSEDLQVQASYFQAQTEMDIFDIQLPDPKMDSDGDGLNDYAEAYWGFNPNLPDSDGDGISDADQLQLDFEKLREGFKAAQEALEQQQAAKQQANLACKTTEDCGGPLKCSEDGKSVETAKCGTSGEEAGICIVKFLEQCLSTQTCKNGICLGTACETVADCGDALCEGGLLYRPTCTNINPRGGAPLDRKYCLYNKGRSC